MGRTIGTPQSISFWPRYSTCPMRGADVVVLDRFDDAAGHRLHVAAGHAAVGVQALVDDHQVAGFLVQCVVVQRQPAADVDQRVLLAAHRAAVGVGAELLQDLGDRLVARSPPRAAG